MLLFATILFGFYGIIENDTTWSDTAYLTGDVLVTDSVTLTIDPGTHVVFDETCKWDTVWAYEDKEHPRSIEGRIDLIVEGNLRAMGSSDDSIYLSETEGYQEDIGNVILVNGLDSLSYCVITIGLGELGGNFGHGYPGMAFLNVEVSISRCLFKEGFGIWGKNAMIDVNNTEFRNIYASMYLGDCAGTGNLLRLDGGSLYFDHCSLTDTDILLGAVISASNLDSCVIKNTVVKGADGYGTGDAPPPTGADDAGGCECINCQYVEIVNCAFDLIRGGDGDASVGVGNSGGDGFGIYLRNCANVMVKENFISDISGGGGGSARSSGGNGGDAIGISLTSCGNVAIDSNYISNLREGSGGSGGDWDGSDGTSRPFVCKNSNPMITNNEFQSEGIYVYIDSTSQPIIGGAPDKSNRFLNLGDKEDYVIYNGSPYDIDATWNFWQTSPSMIDSLIFDYYDDPTKGIVHYDNFTDVEEKESSTEPFTLRSNLVKDILHVSLSRGPTGGLVQLALFDASGRKVMSRTIQESQASIDVSGFPQGVYFVSARIEQSERIIRKVVVCE